MSELPAPDSTGPAATAIVPNFNGSSFIGECLQSLAKQTWPVRIVVVDDASTDGSVEFMAEQFPDVECVRRDVNAGFAVAANEGVRTAITPWVAVVNSDVQLAPDWVEVLLRHATRAPATTWALGGVMCQPGSDIVDSAGDCYATDGVARRGARGRLLAELATEPYPVFAPPGSAVIFRRETFTDLGGFDERFGMYVEDIELACRAHRRGLSAMVVPRAVGEHATARSSDHRRAYFLLGRNGLWCWLRHSPALDVTEFLKASRRQAAVAARSDAKFGRAFRRGRIVGLATALPWLRRRGDRLDPGWRRRMEAAMALRPPAAGAEPATTAERG